MTGSEWAAAGLLRWVPLQPQVDGLGWLSLGVVLMVGLEVGVGAKRIVLPLIVPGFAVVVV